MSDMLPFIISGVLYLVGVGIVLVLRPSFMFTPDGGWKEFGIGKNEDHYTPFPFWLFCIVLALVTYVIVVMLLPSSASSASPSLANNSRSRNNNLRPTPAFDEPVELPKGYYVLNKKATKLAGVPKYVYLGAEEPGAYDHE
jgi:hypothetical protein